MWPSSVPDVEALTAWAAEKGIAGGLDTLLENDDVRAHYSEQLERYQEDVFKGFEKVKNFAFVAEEFSTENEMLTPTMKLKRRNVIKVYQPLLDSLYE